MSQQTAPATNTSSAPPPPLSLPAGVPENTTNLVKTPQTPATAAKPPLPRATRATPRPTNATSSASITTGKRSTPPGNQPSAKRLHNLLPVRPLAASAPRENAVPREVFLLTGGVTLAPIAPHLPPHIITAKPTRKNSWVIAPFRNSARKDGLTFSHWTRVGAPSDSAFARFNKQIKMITYSKEEYEKYLKNLIPLADAPKGEKERPNTNAKLPKSERNDIHNILPQAAWTKEETDTLFSLCRRFDMRFPIVHDRWPTSLSPRSVDELKDRYYSVARRLIDVRTAADPSYVSKQPLAIQRHAETIIKNQFDYEYECVRKNQLEWAYRRSKQELREEEETVRKARRIEANRRRIHKERQRLAKLLAPTPEIAADTARQTAIPPKLFPHRKHTTGAFARSTMIYAQVSNSAKVAKRVDAALIELGIGLRPTPTALVVDNFDLLRMDILAFMELARTVQRKEEEVHQLRCKLAKLKGDPPPPAPPGISISNKKRKADESDIASLFGTTS
ncbi:DNA methyltransferase 1-associated protein 1 [Gracilariopsis chorda]|uniref:DNA methyltransferase 1-associated protein 1 n=1 Tax=Gracilariopsis chorda TaxID=448386 RepID=A0A2V3IRK1_9FLOR|nr:DNA methyltransferase 1-associated protein 1 [Gracilariopsis chorda]|eukprot:PXF44738.1 DNA methyltransferase 1-associated protein 1 [Gracilariopsis chorda]